MVDFVHFHVPYQQSNSCTVEQSDLFKEGFVPYCSENVFSVMVHTVDQQTSLLAERIRVHFLL
jgi:hypothetical protein